MKSTPRREFLLLADTFKADKNDPIGMVGSEKLDGNRCFWDGGVSRGDATVNVPWAGILDPKTGERKAKIKPKATGLWSRYGNPIQAPDWFLDSLPPTPLDGELYAGRGNFQLTQRIVRRDDPNAGDWTKIKFLAFAAPSTLSTFQTGQIKNPNQLTFISMAACQTYWVSRGGRWDVTTWGYERERELLAQLYQAATEAGLDDVFDVVYSTEIESMAQLDTWVKGVCEAGGEGVILREPDSVWFPKRRPLLLKVKPRPDAEATIVGFVAGKKGKTGHLLGRVGTLQCIWHGDETADCGILKAPVSFEIGTGLTHKDREIDPVESFELACENPGKPLPTVTTTGRFSVGDRVTFSYMGITKDLRPREPAFLRLRGEE